MPSSRVRPLATAEVALLHLPRSLASHLRLFIEYNFHLIVAMYSTKRRTMGLLELKNRKVLRDVYLCWYPGKNVGKITPKTLIGPT